MIEPRIGTGIEVKKNIVVWFATAGLAFLLALVAPLSASAGYFEVSGGFSYSNSAYGAGNYEWVRRWTVSAGYHFSDRTEVEFTFQDMIDRTKIAGYQDTTFHDQTYTFAWVQSLFGREAIADPYFKLGIGQLNHTANGSYSMLGGASADSVVDTLTEVIGIGVRIGVTKRFAIRFEASTYITDFKLSTWRNNEYFTAGFSYYF